mmetsp:Transcript_45582/g.108429  ORF Transcript_45582/g.108429 Transcript_45582/m.108429 type:complete len:387 (+) Transcript_45582:1900-3060(+)
MAISSPRFFGDLGDCEATDAFSLWFSSPSGFVPALGHVTFTGTAPANTPPPGVMTGASKTHASTGALSTANVPLAAGPKPARNNILATALCLWRKASCSAEVATWCCLSLLYSTDLASLASVLSASTLRAFFCCSSKTLTAALCPHLLAKVSAVQPSLSSKSGFAFDVSSIRIAPTAPLWAANISADAPPQVASKPFTSMVALLSISLSGCKNSCSAAKWSAARLSYVLAAAIGATLTPTIRSPVSVGLVRKPIMWKPRGARQGPKKAPWHCKVAIRPVFSIILRPFSVHSIAVMNSSASKVATSTLALVTARDSKRSSPLRRTNIMPSGRMMTSPMQIAACLAAPPDSLIKLVTNLEKLSSKSSPNVCGSDCSQAMNSSISMTLL